MVEVAKIQKREGEKKKESPVNYTGSHQDKQKVKTKKQKDEDQKKRYAVRVLDLEMESMSND